MTPVMPSPVSIILGKIRTGSLVSSAMLTESSKPTIAKKASEVAAVTAKKADLSPGDSKMRVRDQSPAPPKRAKKPTKMTRSRPESSTRVSTMLALTLSPTPRKLMAATRAMKASAMTRIRPLFLSSRLKPLARLAAKARDAVEADVMPEHITVKQTMNVRKWMPNALCV